MKLDPSYKKSSEYDFQLEKKSTPIEEKTRIQMWETVSSVLNHHDTNQKYQEQTGILLGNIQSGKTTAMISMTALAHDKGFRLIIAILGTTNLLLEQNTKRFLEGLDLDNALRGDWEWKHVEASSKGYLIREIGKALNSEKTVLVTVLKHAGRIHKLSEQLSQLDLSEVDCLIIDDEGDRASLNTEILAEDESSTYASIRSLKNALPKHLFVQVTATPYAPLLLSKVDELLPSFVEMLTPGKDYTGAREFFIENYDQIIRPIQQSDELKEPPQFLPLSLKKALANFLLGAAHLLSKGRENAPISMLINPTHLTSIHARVVSLIEQELKKINSQLQKVHTLDELQEPFSQQVLDLERHGVSFSDPRLLDQLKEVVRLTDVSMINSSKNQSNLKWNSSPVHILVGGNKLDRGFTVEGLTVTYLSRKASKQLDTLAQRARAFGYRKNYLPYCRFFASPDTIEGLRGQIQTDDYLRADLTKWVEANKPIRDWGDKVGVILRDGIVPSRKSVLPSLTLTPSRGWHMLINPDLSDQFRYATERAVENLGILEAERISYGGNLSFKTLREIEITTVVDFISQWPLNKSSGWSRHDIPSFLSRVSDLQQELKLDIVLMDNHEKPRRRSWNKHLGFSNLMQGRSKDGAYPGDRSIFQNKSGLQIHWVEGIDGYPPTLYTLAIHVGDEIVAATEVRRNG